MARIHFVGIGGVGVNALAKFVAELGFEVSGSDAHVGALALSVSGDVREGICPEAVDGACMLVYTEAVGSDHPEIARARELGMPVLPRQKMLGEVAALFDRSVAVAGTHGKTTTTAMLSHILRAQDKKFVAMIGGEGVDMGNYVNNRLAFDMSEAERLSFVAHLSGEERAEFENFKSKMLSCGGIFVTEACEYKRSFLCLKPYIGVVTNVEYDHPDCYASLVDVKRAFGEFASRCRIIISEDAYNVGERHAVKLSGSGLDARMALSADGKRIFCGKHKAELTLRVGGDYNLQNALQAVAAAYALGIDLRDAARELESFAGVKRRFERAKDMGGAAVYFDFAHHPTEIACAVSRARSIGRTLIVFQPHTFSRTAAYLDDFATALGDGDGELILMPTYAAREMRENGVDVDALEAAIRQKYPKKMTLIATGREDALKKARELCGGYDLVLMLGAGDIYALKDML